MGYIDLIQELRTSEPNVEKAAKAMKYIGWGCIFAGLWNFVLPQVAPFRQSGFSLPASYPYVALGIFAVIGALSLLAARGIREREPWGKKAGQAAIIVLVGSIILFSAVIMPEAVPVPATAGSFKIFLYICSFLIFAQLGVPALFGFWYLGRLPCRDDLCNPANYNPDAVTRSLAERMGERASHPHVATTYKDSPFPFGVAGTFPLIIAVPLLVAFIGQKYARPEIVALIIPLMFIFIFVGPAIFNYRPSPFQENRKLVAAHTGGGSIFLFNGSWPFFRLMVYEDALEVRVMFQRYLIPFDKMEDIPDKIGFFSTGLLIKSDLPEVPSRIRFSVFGIQKVVDVVNAAKKKYLKAAVGSGGSTSLVTIDATAQINE